MGNMQCPAEDAALLASVARTICPFPNYNPNPLFTNMLSINSTLHLRNHYKAVQSSLTPKQLEDFTLGLRTTFGREGKVTLGGVGVVALSLAVLFDTLAKQVRESRCVIQGPFNWFIPQRPENSLPPHMSTHKCRNKNRHTGKTFNKCQPFNGHIPKTWLHYIARLVWLDVVTSPLFNFEAERESLTAQREDFDLKK
ncbi:hypothetical protein Q5P01_021978 [Channa striata]|uniref:Uncharacterized protein n=1 Tax=Channa striata TaxID=64152 RepID=A0AA88IX17_CHASR|nr:hypothetical protein Q5P01_021978 [Channa striata]